MLLLNTDPAEIFRVEAGDRIAQLVLTPVALAEPVEVEALPDSARGERRLRLQRPLSPRARRRLRRGRWRARRASKASSSGSSSGREP